MRTWDSAKTVAIAARVGPTASAMAVLVNPANPTLAETNTMGLQAAARALGLELHVLNASTERDFDEIFAKLIQLRAGGLVIGPDIFFSKPQRTARRTGCPSRGANDLPKSRVRRGRRAAE